MTDPKDLAELCKELRSECDRAENNCPPHDHPPRFKVPTLVMRQLLDDLEKRLAECTAELDQEREKVGTLMQPRLGDSAAGLLLQKWTADYTEEKQRHRRQVADLEEKFADLERQLAERARQVALLDAHLTGVSDLLAESRRRCHELESLLATQSELAANGTAVIKDVQGRACEIERQRDAARAKLADLQRRFDGIDAMHYSEVEKHAASLAKLAAAKALIDEMLRHVALSQTLAHKWLDRRAALDKETT